MNDRFLATTMALMGVLAGGCRKAPDQGAAAERDATSSKDRASAILSAARAGLVESTRAFEAVPLDALERDALQAKTTLVDARRGVEPLRTAPLSFIAVAAPTGRVIRSSLEVDALASSHVDPGCAATKATGEVATVLPGKLGPALLLCAATPKKDGTLVAGFTYQDLAVVLRNHVRDGYDAARDAGTFTSKTPLLYAAVFDDQHLAWTPETPDVTRDACERTGFRAAGFSSPAGLEIEERPYAIAKRELAAPGGVKVSFVLVHSDI